MARPAKITARPFSFGKPVSKYQSNEDLAASGEAFYITAVKYEPGEGFEGADRWLISTSLDPSCISLSPNKDRNAIMEALAEHLFNTQSKYGPVVFVKSGRAYYFNDATPEDTAEIPF